LKVSYVVEEGIPLVEPKCMLSPYFFYNYASFSRFSEVGFFLIKIPVFGFLSFLGWGSLPPLQKEAGGSSSSDITVMFLVIYGNNLSSRLKLNMKLVLLMVSVISLIFTLESSAFLGEYAEPAEVSTRFIVSPLLPNFMLEKLLRPLPS